MSFCGSMYKPDDRDRSAFGERYKPPAEFPHDGWTQVAEYESGDNSDGQNVAVDESRMPARFFRLRVLPGPNSVGEMQPGYEVATGSGMEQWVAETAEQIAEGMVVFRPAKPQ